MKKRFLPILILCLIFGSACATRVPSAKAARSTAHSFFKSYGNKYKNSLFTKNVSNVTINSVEEVSYKIAYVDSNVELSDGTNTRALLKMEHRFPRGWNVISWEILSPENQTIPLNGNPDNL